MKQTMLVFLLFSGSTLARAGAMTCSLAGYQERPGLVAAVQGQDLLLEWSGERNTELRTRLAIENGGPVIRELAVRNRGGAWGVLGRNLVPEYRVTSGVRRMSEQQAAPLRELGIEITPEIIERNRWYAFWDAPLQVPGIRPGQKPLDFRLPRKPEEIRRSSASFTATSCAVKTNGERLEATFDGLHMGIFAGALRFTVYHNSNLIRMEAIAKTEELWVAYKYEGGLRGFRTPLLSRLMWRDTGGEEQEQRFGGAKNEAVAPLRAANRLLVAEGQTGSLAVFPPPHTFFFAREVETNLGYLWYRNDGGGNFAMGVRQADGEDIAEYAGNFALYNAPPGTRQHMALYFYASPEPAESLRNDVLALTHGDRFKPVPGYKVFANHFHIDFTARLRVSGSLDTPLQDLVAMKALGLNIVGLSDFHDSEAPLTMDPGPQRFPAQKDYFEGCRRASDKDFLVLPWEEPDVYLGGHYDVLWGKPFYFSKTRSTGDPFIASDPIYGRVYHLGNAAETEQMIEEQDGYWCTSHPRTKGSTGYPDAFLDKSYVQSDRNLGVSFKPGMGMDLSEQRLCEWRCFGSVDLMNNRYANSAVKPKYLIADVDTYQKGPGDDLYGSFPVNYVKLDRLPSAGSDWAPILKALRDGAFFVTTGEILFKNFEWRAQGEQAALVANVEWTFPLEFFELVWGDGNKVDRQVISATDLPPFGSKHLVLPFDRAGKSWIRFAVWDSAGNGGFLQPVWLRTARSTTRAFNEQQ